MRTHMKVDKTVFFHEGKSFLYNNHLPFLRPSSTTLLLYQIGVPWSVNLFQPLSPFLNILIFLMELRRNMNCVLSIIRECLHHTHTQTHNINRAEGHGLSRRIVVE